MSTTARATSPLLPHTHTSGSVPSSQAKDAVYTAKKTIKSEKRRAKKAAAKAADAAVKTAEATAAGYATAAAAAAAQVCPPCVRARVECGCGLATGSSEGMVHRADIVRLWLRLRAVAVAVAVAGVDTIMVVPVLN